MPSHPQCFKVLLIEDRLDEAELIQEMIQSVIDTPFTLTRVDRLHQGLQCLHDHPYDVVLLDLRLPDSDSLETLLQVKNLAPTVPIVVLTNISDKNIALEALRLGAQDYLPKGQFDGELLMRSINYAIERQRIKEELRQQVERERLMGRMIERIRQSLDLRNILDTTVDEVRQFLNTDRVLIYCSQGKECGRIVAEAVKLDWHDRSRLHSKKILMLLEPLFSALKTPMTETTNRLRPSVGKDNSQSIEELINSLLTVPIWQDRPYQETRLWGQLIVQEVSNVRQWQVWEVEFLTQLANQVAIAIQQSELYQAVQKQANIDGLTGIANRRHFDRTLNEEWQRLARQQEPLSLILCDVDFFKQYNDFYGHLTGDDCLKEVAKVIAGASQRATDIASRYGGEEFAVILPKTSREGAIVVAHHIQHQLHEQKLPHHRSTVSTSVTVSIGIATLIPTLDENPDILIEAADRALRKAKEDGRNCIVQE